MMKPFPQLFAGLAVLSVSLFGSAIVGGSAIRDFKAANDVLTITGSAKRPIQSDYIIVSFTISSQESTAKAAYQNLKTQSDRVESYLKNRDVEEDNIISLRSKSKVKS